MTIKNEFLDWEDTEENKNKALLYGKILEEKMGLKNGNSNKYKRHDADTNFTDLGNIVYRFIFYSLNKNEGEEIKAKLPVYHNKIFEEHHTNNEVTLTILVPIEKVLTIPNRKAISRFEKVPPVEMN